MADRRREKRTTSSNDVSQTSRSERSCGLPSSVRFGLFCAIFPLTQAVEFCAATHASELVGRIAWPGAVRPPLRCVVFALLRAELAGRTEVPFALNKGRSVRVDLRW